MKKQFQIIFTLLLFTACSYAQDTRTVYEKLDPMEFQSKMQSSVEYQLIDVRTSGEFEQGTIDGAMNLNILNGELANNLGNLDKNQPVFIFCQMGGRSSQAAKLLQENGFIQIYELKEGYSSWNQ